MAQHPALDDPNAYVLYRYIPSVPAAAIFLVLFICTTALHAFQLFKHRSYFFIPLLIGGCFELAGYAARIASHSDVWALSPFIVQSLLLLVAPALFAASIYITFGRLILFTDGEQYSLVRQSRITLFFVCGDVLSFLMQGSGGGIQAGGSLSSLETGEKIIIGGLCIQIIFFGFFVIVAGLFHWRIVKARGKEYLRSTRPCMDYLYALYATSLLILIRSVFRVIEYAMGNNGYLLRHEAFLYVFDATLMFLVLAIFNFVHPGQKLSGVKKAKKQAGVGVRDEEVGAQMVRKEPRQGYAMWS